MIRRGNANKTPSAVNSAESETLSVNKGIVRNAGPNDLASVVDSCNFRLREDGSYAIRKPDVLLRSGGSASFPMRDGKRILYVGTNGYVFITPEGVTTGTSSYVILKYRPLGSDSYTYKYRPGPGMPRPTCKFKVVSADSWEPDDNAAVYILDDARTVRAGDVTLIPALIDRTIIDDLVDDELYPTEYRMLPRWLSVYYDEDYGRWVAEVIEPEPNTLVDGGEGASFEPNLLLDNPYSLKDIYGYGSVGVQGIVAYQDETADPVPDPSTSYVKQSQGSFTKTLSDALFKVECKAGNINVYTTAHMALAPLNRCMGPSGNPATADELYEMDGEIMCGIGSVVRVNASNNTPETVCGDKTKLCSGYIPAYTTLGTLQLTNLASCVLTIRVYLYVDSVSEATLYVYPGNVSVDALHTMNPREVSVSFAHYTEITLTLDANGDVVSQDNGFVFGYDDKGMYIDVSDALSDADLYSLSTSAFASDSDAAKAALPYSYGGKTYLDPSNASWTFYYYTWNLPSGSSYYDGLDGIKVKELTERVDDVWFKMVSELSADDERPIVLKAMMTFSKAMSLYYGVWETSEDGGVTWTVCPEFVRAWRDSLVDIPTVDSTYSQETLTSTSDYIKYVKAAPIVAESGDDPATDRVDVLAISQTPKTNLFRFSVYRYEKAATSDAVMPMIVAVPTVDVPQTAHLECPKRGSVYIVGTRMYMHNPYTYQGIAVFVPDCDATTGKAISVKYAVTDDLSKVLTDADCANGYTVSQLARPSTGTGYMFLMHQENFVTNISLTHAMRVRVAVFVNGVAIPGFSLDAVYMYSSPSVVKGAEALSTASLAGSRAKFTTAAEPIVKITSETGHLKVSSGSSTYPFGNYSPNDQLRFSESNGAITANYSSSFSVTNPTNAYMLVAFGCNVPTQSHGDAIFPTSQASLTSNARLVIDGVTSNGDFTVNNAYRVKPAFQRGGSVKYKLLAPHQTVSVEYAYSLTTAPLGNTVFGRQYVSDIIKTMAFPISVISLQGDLTATAKSFPSFSKTAAYYASTYYHAVNHASYYGQAYPHPVYDADNYSGDLPNTYANGTLTKMESAITSTPLNSAYVKKGLLVSFKPYLPNLVETRTSYVVKDSVGLPDLTVGRHVYHEHRVLTYGVKGFENVLYVSGVDSYITPLQNALEFSYGSAVTSVMPWRDYVIVFTENATYMLLKDSSSNSGYAMRTVNSQIGVPASDGDSVQAILNGILFKSGDKAYVYVPGRYSTVDTMLNIRRISDPIEGFLLEGAATLSFVQDDEWHLFQKTVDENDQISSVELVYNYAKNVWTRHTHSFFPDDWFRYGTSWVMFITYRFAVMSYGKDIPDMLLYEYRDAEPYDLSKLVGITYGDYLSDPTLMENLSTYGDDIEGSLSQFDSKIHPIPFSIDMGQKSSRFTVAKQFLELKFNLMSLDDKDAFPLTLTVYADGMPHRHVVDANTDSPFWRDSKTLDAGAASTTFGDADTSNVGIMRQMFVKYSGRGKTLRVTFSGESQSRFAVYTVDSRYRVLPNKQ